MSYIQLKEKLGTAITSYVCSRIVEEMGSINKNSINKTLINKYVDEYYLMRFHEYSLYIPRVIHI